MSRGLAMCWREAVLAIQFLTRLPTPQWPDFDPMALARAVRWFPAVGLLLGSLIVAAARLGTDIDPWLGALAVLLAWVALTGALHLDGLADLCDALGAAHRDPQRLLAVMKDPHLGSFGVLALLLQCCAKLVLALLLVRAGAWPVLLLAPAWARWGVFAWQLLPPLAPGMAERFAWHRPPHAPWGWAVALAALSAWLAPVLLLAPLAVLGYHCWLARRLGGVSGDCLGAGIELTETALLVSAVVAAAL
ncbi:adenosylcobinamide-GDP ribazoletransferase [Chitiniphilus purpureus]|uniref:Adenosylcobinamide-GDP ribazoletransferase n=1 Tax=Chitiniphilus purpureus TaxID=2981137 RepID=A0ABY6DVU5_9NEIS|nr:adenosylcobinamide-GDP ribazoletransferase [Chitiniphilus sp. CD1]UXY15973.1 adenosylcobinamide-GDP ribazoletransferase [Chitiniphilus sp. CD1]